MTGKTVDYYLSLNSPWTYLGHDRFMAMARAAGATVRLWPVDFSLIFPRTGGLPVPKRSPERQAYRLMELERWRAWLGVPLNLHPAHWPADDRIATGMVMAARDRGEDAARLAGAYLRAVWAGERDIGDEHTIIAIAGEQELDGGALRALAEEKVAGRDQDSQEAIARGVFGAPSYVIGDEVFWGQDRLDFVQRALG